MIDTQLITGILITLILSAFFSGMEIAFVASNRMLAEVENEGRGRLLKIINFFYRNPNDFVCTMLVGNNIVLVIFGILIAKLLDATLFQGFSAGFTVPADTLLSTLIVLFTAEFLPKALFKANANTLFAVLSPIALLFYIVLWPVSRFSTGLSHLLLRIIGVKVEKPKAGDEFSRIDLDYLVQSTIENAENIDEVEEEVKIFQNALDFTDTKVKDCMIPRTEIIAVDFEECTLDELRQKFIESGHGKLLVYKEDIDHIIGYVHSSELFKIKSDNAALKEIDLNIQKIQFVPETMAAQKLMKILLQEKKSLAVVVDEFGGTSGLVSLEDIVEEIFGDIEDEHDSSNYIANKIGENEYMLSARLEIDKVNELFELDLPESQDYMTIGGLILYKYESFPKLNEIVKIDRFEFKIIKKTQTKLEIVKLKVL